MYLFILVIDVRAQSYLPFFDSNFQCLIRVNTPLPEYIIFSTGEPNIMTLSIPYPVLQSQLWGVDDKQSFHKEYLILADIEEDPAIRANSTQYLVFLTECNVHYERFFFELWLDIKWAAYDLVSHVVSISHDVIGFGH